MEGRGAPPRAYLLSLLPSSPVTSINNACRQFMALAFAWRVWRAACAARGAARGARRVRAWRARDVRARGISMAWHGMAWRARMLARCRRATLFVPRAAARAPWRDGHGVYVRTRGVKTKT